MTFVQRTSTLLFALLTGSFGCAIESSNATTDASSLESAMEKDESVPSDDVVHLAPQEKLESLSLPGGDGCLACRPGPIPWQDQRVTPRAHED